MAHFASLKLNGIFHGKSSVFRYNPADIGLLAAHGGIKRGLLHKNGSSLTIG